MRFDISRRVCTFILTYAHSNTRTVTPQTKKRPYNSTKSCTIPWILECTVSGGQSNLTSPDFSFPQFGITEVNDCAARPVSRLWRHLGRSRPLSLHGLSRTLLHVVAVIKHSLKGHYVVLESSNSLFKNCSMSEVKIQTQKYILFP